MINTQVAEFNRPWTIRCGMIMHIYCQYSLTDRVQAKDCVQLLHLWLAKHELETRRVKNRSFEGVDPRELDLIPTISLLD